MLMLVFHNALFLIICLTPVLHRTCLALRADCKHSIAGGGTDEGSNNFGDGEAKSGVPTPVFAVTAGGYTGSTRQREVSIHQVGTCGGSGMPLGLIVGGKCVTCKNSNGRCVHRSMFEKSQGHECAGNLVTSLMGDWC